MPSHGLRQIPKIKHSAVGVGVGVDQIQRSRKFGTAVCGVVRAPCRACIYVKQSKWTESAGFGECPQSVHRGGVVVLEEMGVDGQGRGDLAVAHEFGNRQRGDSRRHTQ